MTIEFTLSMSSYVNISLLLLLCHEQLQSLLFIQAAIQTGTTLMEWTQDQRLFPSSCLLLFALRT